MPESPYHEAADSVGPEVPERGSSISTGIRHAAPFVRPQHVNTNDDIMLMYFTSGTTGSRRWSPTISPIRWGISAGVLLAQPPRGQPAPHHCRHRMGEGRLGQVVRAMAGRGQHFRLRPREIFTPADILRKIRTVPDNLPLCAPPTIYRFLIREDLSKYDLSSLEYCTTAGEALNGAVYDTFKRRPASV